MTYANIPQELLDIVLGEGWQETWTLKDQIDEIGEDIITAEFDTHNNENGTVNKIRSFTAWTATYVLVLVDTAFGDQALISLKRNP
jgi:hypothetical protein